MSLMPCVANFAHFAHDRACDLRLADPDGQVSPFRRDPRGSLGNKPFAYSGKAQEAPSC